MSEDINLLREEFKANYKKYIVATTGTWTHEDEERMYDEIKEIEDKSTFSAFLVVSAFTALLFATVLLGLRLFGVI